MHRGPGRLLSRRGGLRRLATGRPIALLVAEEKGLHRHPQLKLATRMLAGLSVGPAQTKLQKVRRGDAGSRPTVSEDGSLSIGSRRPALRTAALACPDGSVGALRCLGDRFLDHPAAF